MPVLDEATITCLKCRQLRCHPRYCEIWNNLYSNELGRLLQVIGKEDTGTNQRVAGTDTFFVISSEYIPSECIKDITYTKLFCEVNPQKADPNRTRITIG